MLRTLSVVLLAVLVFLLEKFATVLQQLFTAAFLAYALLPLQRWLVRHGVPSALAYLFITLTLFTLGVLAVLAVQGSFADLSTKLPRYRDNCTQMMDRIAAALPGVGRNRIDPLR